MSFDINTHCFVGRDQNTGRIVCFRDIRIDKSHQSSYVKRTGSNFINRWHSSTVDRDGGHWMNKDGLNPLFWTYFRCFIGDIIVDKDTYFNGFIREGRIKRLECTALVTSVTLRSKNIQLTST